VTTTRWTWGRALAAGVAALVLLAAGCGDDDSGNNASSGDGGTTTTEASSGSGSGSASSQVCDDLDQLKSDVAKLGEIDTSEDVSASLSSTVDEIGQDVSDLGDAAGDEIKPEVAQLKSSLSVLKSAVEDLGSEGGVRAAANALQAVLTDAGAVADKLASTDCS
jgi:hypothetical protein